MGTTICTGKESINSQNYNKSSFQMTTLWIDQNKERNYGLSEIQKNKKILKKYQIIQIIKILFSLQKGLICLQNVQKETIQDNNTYQNWLLLKKQRNTIMIDSNLQKDNNLVVQILPANIWHQLSYNDKFKIGKSIFRFIQSGQYQKFKSQKLFKVKTSKLGSIIASKLRLSKREQCRICLQNEQTQQNLLISPCSCSGSLQNIHMQCLNKCLFQFKDIGNKIVQIQSKNVICNICNSQFSQENSYYNQIMCYLLDKSNKRTCIPDSSKNIAVLQAILQTKKEQHKRTFYLIAFEQNEILDFGRNSNFADLKNDTSISRKNTCLKFQRSKVQIRDESSRNGTGILLKFPYEIHQNTQKIFRVGKKLIVINNNKLLSQ